MIDSTKKYNLISLEKILNYSFKDKKLLINSLTHTSVNSGELSSMERLEFLGDRVLGLIISEELLYRFPLATEGELSKKFSYLVQRNTCADIARNINLDKYIILGKSEILNKKIKDSILSNIMESLIGSIFLDSNYIKTKKIVIELWRDLISNIDIKIKFLNPKSELQEKILSMNKSLPEYNFISVRGEDHNPIFTVSVSVMGLDSVIAEGKSKQEAEKNAAKEILKIMNNE